MSVFVCVGAPKGFSRSAFVLLAFRSRPGEGVTHFKLDLADTETLLSVSYWPTGSEHNFLAAGLARQKH